MNKIYSHKIFIQTFELENTQNTGITVIGITGRISKVFMIKLYC